MDKIKLGILTHKIEIWECGKKNIYKKINNYVNSNKNNLMNKKTQLMQKNILKIILIKRKFNFDNIKIINFHKKKLFYKF